jgi:tetratricopeptide (TPR) repeat protein
VLNHPEIRIHHYGYEFSEMQRVEKFSRALRVMEDYIERNPHDAYILTKLGETYSYLRRYEDAERYFKKAMEIDPDCIDSPSAHMHLGIIYTRKGMLDEAIAEYKKALVTNGDYAKAHYNLSIAYYKKGNYGKAIEHSDKALSLGFEVHPEFLELLRPYRGRMQQAG